MHRPIRSLIAALLSLFAGATASVSLATEAIVENYGNTPIFVAVAHQRPSDNHIVKGWFRVDPSEQKTFTSPDNQQMYMLIHREGVPVIFNHHQEFRRFPVSVGKRFRVDRPDDDNGIRFLHWGTNLEYAANVIKGQYPEGWDRSEFFYVGTGVQRLEVRP